MDVGKFHTANLQRPLVASDFVGGDIPSALQNLSEGGFAATVCAYHGVGLAALDAQPVIVAQRHTYIF